MASLGFIGSSVAKTPPPPPRQESARVDVPHEEQNKTKTAKRGAETEKEVLDGGTVVCFGVVFSLFSFLLFLLAFLQGTECSVGVPFNSTTAHGVVWSPVLHENGSVTSTYPIFQTADVVGGGVFVGKGTVETPPLHQGASLLFLSSVDTSRVFDFNDYSSLDAYEASSTSAFLEANSSSFRFFNKWVLRVTEDAGNESWVRMDPDPLVSNATVGLTCFSCNATSLLLVPCCDDGNVYETLDERPDCWSPSWASDDLLV